MFALSVLSKYKKTLRTNKINEYVLWCFEQMSEEQIDLESHCACPFDFCLTYDGHISRLCENEEGGGDCDLTQILPGQAGPHIVQHNPHVVTSGHLQKYNYQTWSLAIH